MGKLFVTSATLLLSSTFMLAQPSTRSTASDASLYPDTRVQAAQQPDKSTQPTSDRGAQTIEGCLSGETGTFVLTVESGETYEVSGDTSQLQANVGHQVRLSGSKGSTGGGSKSSASGPQETFAVKTVDSLSDHCK